MGNVIAVIECAGRVIAFPSQEISTGRPEWMCNDECGAASESQSAGGAGGKGDAAGLREPFGEAVPAAVSCTDDRKGRCSTASRVITSAATASATASATATATATAVWD